MPRRLPGVEGLRALAASAVLLHHVPMIAHDRGTEVWLSGVAGDVFANLRWGLILFFALSGFLLFRPFAHAIITGEALPSIRAYARHRVLRIMPAYWVILLATAFLLGTAMVWGGDGTGIPSFGVLAADLLLLQNYSPDTVLTGIGPAWSLAVEVVFYAVLPVLAVGSAAVAARRAGPRGRVLAAIGAATTLIVIGLVSKTAFRAGLTPEGWHMVATTLMPLHADLFGYGMLAAVAHVLHAEGRLTVRPGPLLGTAALLGIVTAVVAPSLGMADAGGYADVAIGTACALVLLAVCATGAGCRVLDCRPVVWVGLISYSVYLWHVPVLTWLREHGLTADTPATLLAVAAVTVLATGLLSALTWRFVERPAYTAAKRTTPSDSFSTTAPSIASKSTWPRTSLNVR